MALNSRQLRLYTDTCDLYRPAPLSDARLGRDINPLSHLQTPAYTGVKYFHESRPEIEHGKFFGKINREDTVSLIDAIHMDVAQEAGVNWHLVNTNPESPYYNQTFILTGDEMTKNHRANKKVYFAKRVIEGLYVSG
jgi:hypothetical protein